MKLVFSTNNSRILPPKNTTETVYNTNVTDTSIPVHMLASKKLSHIPIVDNINNRFMHQPSHYTSSVNMFSTPKNFFYNNSSSIYATNCKNCGK